MGKWRDAFEAGAEEERAYRRSEGYGIVEYILGPPASVEQLVRLERFLAPHSIPEDLRGLLSEFNGVWTRASSGEKEILYLDIDHIVEEDLITLPNGNVSIPVQHYFKNCGGNPLPPTLTKVVFVAHNNGYAALFGLCLEDFGELRKGQVLMLANDIGEFEIDHESLIEFVKKGCK